MPIRFTRFAGAVAAALLSCVAAQAALADDEIEPRLKKVLTSDAPKSADNPLTGRYGGSVILSQTKKPFDELLLPSSPALGKSYSSPAWDKRERAEGQVTRTIYLINEERSTLEVLRNFTDALTAKGFEIAFQCAAEDCGEAFPSLKYSWDNKQALVVGSGYDNARQSFIPAVFDYVKDVRYALLKKVAPEGTSLVGVYTVVMTGGSNGNISHALTNTTQVLLEVVEPKPMERRIETVKAAEIGSKLGGEGRVVFYGIYFDFDKAELKPESEPQLAEMAKFLTDNPTAKVYVTGHTDNKGGLDYNLALSERRAKAVVAALVSKYGIAPARLTPKGLGPLAPLASNASEDGQAKNRRVEMVLQ
ncbi:OmpA family protein [Zavarzinia sp.]|uniref:OmpA family protein n=1 Tax=Zavarzinia sp. TaxID=2027920 RepID=UPI0035615404